MKLFVGLGNPEPKYETTRHNLGFVAVDMLAREFRADDFADEKRFFARVVRVASRGQEILLAQPTTYMNQSGKAVQAIAGFYHIQSDDVWVLHDELDLPVGAIRHSLDSRAAGHNGVQSVIDALGTTAFHRIRIGIGHPEPPLPADAYVLQPLLEEERSQIMQTLKPFLRTTISELFG